MNTLFFGLLLLIFCDVCFGKFTIIGLNNVVAGSKYRSVLNLVDGSDQVTVKVNNGELYDEVFDTRKGLSHDITFEVPKDVRSSRLIISAWSNTEKPITQTINVIESKYDVLVQTDKAIYQPGEKVQFRILVLDYHLKPYTFNSMSISIEDGNGENIRTYNKIFSSDGFVEDSLQLADELNHGQWEIQVKIDDNYDPTRNFFEVIDYLLPEFEVVVEPQVQYIDKKIKVEVSAKYITGIGLRAVTGRTTLNVTIYNSSDLSNPLQIVTKNLGYQNTIDLDFQRDLRISPNFDKTIVKLQGFFEDERSLKFISAQKTVEIFKRQKEKLEIIAESEVFTPGKLYKIRVQEKNFTGMLVPGKKRIEVKLQQQTYWNKNVLDTKQNMKWEKVEVDSIELINGIAEFTYQVPEKVVRIAIGIPYDGSYVVHKAFRLPTQSREHLELKVDTINSKVGEELSVEVSFTNPPTKFFSVIVGKTGVVRNEQHEGRNTNLKIVVTPNMVPISSLNVYYHQSNGEVVFNQVRLEFEEKLGNFLNISLNYVTVEPGSEVSITLKTRPHSIVALAAVNQKVSFVKSGNDIEKSQIDDKTDSFDFFNRNFKYNKDNNTKYCEKSNTFLLTDLEWTQPQNHYRQRRSIDSNEESQMISDTWIFKSYKVGASGELTVKEKVPEIFTSYKISGFSLFSESALGIAEPKILIVSKDLYVELDVPKSLFVGEILRVQVLIYSSRQINSKTIITMEKNHDFEMLQEKKYLQSCSYETSNVYLKEMKIMNSGMAEVPFFIRAVKEGSLTLKVKVALGNLKHETMKKLSSQIRKYETTKSKGKFFDLRSKNFGGYYFDMESDSEANEKTISTEASVVGNLLGESLQNVEGLLTVPDNLEQNLAEHFPKIYALKYLKSTGKLTDSYKNVGINSLGTSYQTIVSRKVKGANNGFSSDSNGVASIETSAFIAKFLSVTKEWVEIEDVNILNALNFLKKNQKANGKFKESNMSEIALTAFVVISFLENTPYASRYKANTDKALKFIDDSFAEIDDSFELAISSYALALGKHVSARKFINELMNKKTERDEQIYWELDEATKEIETASYAILALVQLDKMVEGKEIINWLISMRKPNSVFSTPKANVVGLQALAEVGKHAYSDNFDLTVTFEEKDNVKVNNKNSGTAQKVKIPTKDGVSVQVTGTGVTFVQVWQKYLKKPSDGPKSFEITVTSKNQKQRKTGLNLEVCLQYIGTGNQSKKTVAEVNLPTGFKFAKLIENLKSKTSQEKTVVHVFFNAVKKNQNACFNVEAIKWFGVAHYEQNFVEVYELENKDQTLSGEYYSVHGKCAA